MGTTIKPSIGVNAKWEAKKAKLKMAYPQLTDADLNFEESNQQEMLAALQIKLGKPEAELKIVIETL